MEGLIRELAFEMNTGGVCQVGKWGSGEGPPERGNNTRKGLEALKKIR